MSTKTQQTSDFSHNWGLITGILVIILVILAYLFSGPLVIIIGGSAIGSYFVWRKTTYKHQIKPEKILPLYFMVIAFEIFHQIEEVITDFPGEVSEIMGFDFKFQSFLVLILLLAAFAFIAAFGIMKGHPLAYWYVWFITIGPGLINFIAHIAFPIIRGTIYFPGLITVIFPTFFGIKLTLLMIKETKASER